jgi:thiamine biosynthesis protein ThiS
LQIVVNGDPREVAAGTSVAQLLELLQLPRRFLAVERNLEIVPREQHAECFLNEGDRLEIVTLVGGG